MTTNTEKTSFYFKADQSIEFIRDFRGYSKVLEILIKKFCEKFDSEGEALLAMRKILNGEMQIEIQIRKTTEK